MMCIKRYVFLASSLILLLSIPNLFGLDIFPDGYNINANILTNPLNRDNEIVFVAIPMELYKMNETFEISWLNPTISGTLYYSLAPGGTNIENYTTSGISGFGITNPEVETSIETDATDIGIGVGVYFCVIHNADDNLTSMEFQLIIESSNGVAMNSPGNGTVIEESTPTFSWDFNPGVPYYLLALSDNPFSIEEDEEGDLIVTGINPIWQIITYENSAIYGCQDPSGSFINNPPPLVPDIEYNWLVLNNYGNDPLLSSDVVSAPFGFTYEQGSTIDAPLLISPQNLAEIDGDDYIAFEWSIIEEALTYHIYLSEIRIEAGSEVQYPVWDEATTNNLIDFNAGAILIDSRYLWKVIASDEDGNSVCSEAFEFTYHIPVGTLNLKIRNFDGSTGIGFAGVEIAPVEGSGDNIPLTVNENGNEKKILPVGTYTITASKDGYETEDTLVYIVEDPDIDLDGSNGDTVVEMRLNYSPCFFYGSVVDTNATAIENSTIYAEDSEGEVRTTTTSTGHYSIAVIPGMWTISANKESYSLQSSIEYNIDLDENITLDNLILILNDKDVNGYVENTSGIPLSGVTVNATKGTTLRTKTTNSNGLYQFAGLEIGEWTIFAEKIGYYSPDPTVIEISTLSPSPMSLSNIILTPQANIVSGNTNNSIVGLEGVEIKATPSAGSTVSTYSDEYGNYTINLPSGNYEISAIFDNYTSQNTHQLNLSVGETINNINFTLIPDESWVEGTVTSGGNELVGVTVTAGENQDITDNFGNYSIDVSPGTYLMSASKTGYTSSGTQTISVNAGQTIQDINFVLYPNASVISGTVLTSGNSIANAQVNGYKVTTGAYIQGTTSDENGDYILNLYPGSYKIWAEKNNFICEQDDTLNINVGPGQTITNQHLELTPYEAYIIGTTITQDGNVLRNVSIDIEEVNNPTNSYSTVSGVYGNYSLVVLPKVNYTIFASKSGYSSDEITTEDPIEVGETFTSTLTLSAQPSLITGYTISKHSSDSTEYNLDQATIQAVNVQDTITYQTTSASNGAFSLGISQGDYEITAYKNGYLPATIYLEVNPGTTVDTTLFLEENFSTLQGTITDASTENPIEDALISANLSSGGGGVSYTNSSGFYLLENILPGLYHTITISKENYETEDLTNEVIPAGAIITKDAQLIPLTSVLEVNVEDNSSTPMDNVTIYAENNLTGALTSGLTDNGFCQLTGIAGNVEYNIFASKINYVCDDTLVMILPNDTLSLDFTMQLTNSSIIGVVKNDEGSGLGNVLVSAISPDGFSGNTITEPTGNFTLQNLNPNQYYAITLLLDDYTDAKPDTFELDVESLDVGTLTMVPNDRTITGTVTDQKNNPLEGVNVTATSITSFGDNDTDSNGEFVITGLAPYESYLISTNVFQQGWENTSTSLTIEDAPSNPLPENLVISLHTSKFLGTVTDEDSGDPVSSALITIEDENGNTYSTTSQPDGSYSIKFLYKGHYDFTVMKQSYATKNIDNVFVDHRAQTIQDIELTYTASVTISGYLKDTDDRPIGLTQINLFNQEQSLTTSTDATGSFIFEEVVPYTTTTLGTNLPSLNYDNAIPLVLDIETLDVDTTMYIDIHSADIYGTVSDNFSGEFLSNAEVTLFKDDNEISSITTNSVGYFEFSYLYEGDYKLSVDCSDYNVQDSTFALQDFETLGINMELQRTVVNPPNASFSAAPLSGYVPLTVSFTDESSSGTYPITTWKWYFGDGDSLVSYLSTNPAHEYETPGTYTVTLIVSDGALVNSTSTIISTNAVPSSAEFSASPLSGNAPLEVNFSELATAGTYPITSYLWNFGDGNTSTDQNPAHTYAYSGSFTVSLTVSDGTLSDTETKTDYITVNAVAPSAGFIAAPQTGYAPLDVTFTDESIIGTYNIVSWSWDFGDGNTSTDQNPIHTYENPGDYTIILTVSDGTLSDMEEKIDYITVDAVAPTADFTSNPQSGNAPLSVNFTELASAGTYPITSYFWNFDDGNTSTETNPSHTYPDSGSYSISLTVSDGTLENTETKIDYITVNAIAPSAGFSASPRTGVVPLEVSFFDESAAGTYDIISWHWDFGDDDTSTEINPTHPYENVGNYTVSLTVSDGTLGDTETKTDYITVSEVTPPQADFSATPLSGFLSLEVTFTDESTPGTNDIISWSWGFGDGNTSPSQNPTHTYEDAGIYTVSLTVSDGTNQNTETKTNYITVNEVVSPTSNFIANPVSGYAPLGVNFTELATAGTYPITSYLWDFGDDNTSTSQNPTHTYEDAGIYTVSLTVFDETLENTETKIDYITVNAVAPTSDFTSNPVSGYAPLGVNFTSMSTAGTYPITSYLWDFGDDNTSTSQNPTNTYEDAGIYTVSLTVSDGTLNDTVYKNITVNEPIPPTPAFSAEPMVGYYPATVTFTDNSIQKTHPIGQWDWDFDGDGQVDTTGQGPFEYTYFDAGVYIVSLWVTDMFGYTTGISATKNITVNEPIAPTSSFSATPQIGYAPVTVTFTDNSIQGTHPITTWKWYFGDGDSLVSYLSTNPAHEYETPGTYTVTLIVSDNYLSNSSSKSITVYIGSIAGVVKSSEENLLKNAIVTIYDEINDTVAIDTTNSVGIFSLQGFSSDHTYTLECTKLGYQSYLHPNILGPDSTNVSVVLEMIPNSVLGTVAYEDSEVGDAIVKIKNQEGNVFLTQSDEFGDYLITNVLPEYYDIWGLSSDTTLVSSTQSLNLLMGESALIDIDLDLAAHFEGTVTHNDVGKPGVTIYNSNIISGRIFSEATNSEGYYDIPLPAGTYNVDVILNGFVVNEPMPQISLQPGESKTLDFTLTGINNTISGIAFNIDTGFGIANVKINLSDGISVSDSLFTPSSGSFTFSNLYDGNYTISAYHNAYETTPDSIVILSGGSAPTVNFEMTQKDLTIFGLVRDIQFLPIHNAIVKVYNGDTTNETTTETDGSYSISVDTIGVYSLFAKKENYETSDTSEVEITLEQNVCEFNFILVPEPASIHGKILVYFENVDMYLPPTSAELELENIDETVTLSETISQDSLFEFNELIAPDNFNLEINANYYEQNFYEYISDIYITPGDTVPHEIIFETTAEPPIVSFIGYPLNGDAPLEVTFTDASTQGDLSILSWNWDFGDGTPIDTLQNPVHTYTDSGSFTVSLTVSDGAFEITKTKDDYITVNAVPPVAYFTAEPDSGYAPLQVSFTDKSTPGTYDIISWEWNFGDGTPLDTLQNPTHIYEDAGIYNASLTISDGTLTSIVSANITVIAPIPPTAVFSAVPQSGEAPLEVTFTDNSIAGTYDIINWEWNFGDDTDTTYTTFTDSIVHTYADSGSFTVSLTVSDGVLSNSSNKLITVVNPGDTIPPTASFNAQPTSGYAPLEVTFYDESSTGDTLITLWQWDFGDEDTLSYTTFTDSIVHTYTDSGSYTVTLKVTDENNLFSIYSMLEPINVYVVEPPTANFVGNPQEDFAPLTVTFTDLSASGTYLIKSWDWDFGDGAILSYTTFTDSIIHTYADSGSYTVELIVSDETLFDTLSQTDYITVNAVPPTANFTASPQNGYAPLCVTFLDESTAGTYDIISWRWDFGDETDSTYISFADTILHIYDEPGTYIAELEISDGTLVDSISSDPFIVMVPKYKISGTISMDKDGLIDSLQNATVILKDSTNIPCDTTVTNINGFYQFSDLVEGLYNLRIEAEYDEELFTHNISHINIIADTTINHTFEYSLCSIGFTITEDGLVPIHNVSVKIKSSIFDTTIYTNSDGNCSTNAALHTGDYSVLISKSTSAYGDYINPLSYTITLDTLRHYIQEKQLPLQFDESQIPTQGISGLDTVEILLRKAETYNDEVYLHYNDVDGYEYEIEMTIVYDTLLSAEIPPQLKSGDITFQFTSQSPSLGFFFTSSEYNFQTTYEGILSGASSGITPNEVVFAYDQEAIFEVNLYDDVGNCLNDSVEASGSVVWILPDSTIGEIEQISDEKRMILFTSAKSTTSGKLNAKVTFEGITIHLETGSIQVKDMHLADLIIDGPNEIPNDESCFFIITAESDSGWSIDVPIETEPIDITIGEFSDYLEGILYIPNPNFIGKFDLEIYSFDPNNDTEVTANKQITVYKRISTNSPADTLYSGERCNLTLPDSMLLSGSAKIYLKEVQVSPMQEIGVTKELEGSIFNIYSNKDTYSFADMPGITFEMGRGIDLSNVSIAYWDKTKLRWSSQNTTIEEMNICLDSIPGWFEYGVVAQSDPLGIYDLKLLPNPFSPYDEMGLQIEFRVSSNISRYAKITAKIYTINGTLVQTIVKNKPMLKGEYEAGEKETLYWDGKTKNGKMARNGRYVIQIIAEDASHKEEIVKTIVLIK